VGDCRRSGRIVGGAWVPTLDTGDPPRACTAAPGGLRRQSAGAVTLLRMDHARSLRARFQQTLAGELVRRLERLNPIERGLALGSKLFTTVVPLSILVSALFSTGNVFATRLIEGFGLTGAGAQALRTLFDVPSGQVQAGVSIIGILVVSYSLLSFARALQRVYEDAWQLPPLRTRGVAWGALWMVAFACYFSLSTPIAGVLYRHGFHVGATVSSLVFGSMLWLVTPFILLGRRVPMRVLLPGGIASAVLLSLFNLGSRAYLPHSMSTNIHRYGLVGVTFTILTWLFAFSLTLIVAAATGAVLGERRDDWPATAAAADPAE
jgi:membrane protein